MLTIPVGWIVIYVSRRQRRQMCETVVLCFEEKSFASSPEVEDWSEDEG